MPTPTTPEEAITARLKAHTGLHALVAGRVYPQLTEPDPTYPCVVYQRQGAEPSNTLTATAGPRLTKYAIRVEGYAETEAGLHAVGTQIVAALHQWKNGAVGVQGVFHTDSEVGFAGQDEGGPRYVAHTFAVWFKAA